MFNFDEKDESQKWIIWFFLKLNLFSIGLFLTINGLTEANIPILFVGTILSIVGGVLVYQDAKNDPYDILKLFKVQTILYWRLQGPLISKKPFYYHFPEGSHLQQHDITRKIALKNEELKKGKKIVISTNVPQICPVCNGKRNKELTVQIECPKCKNKGRIIYEVGSMAIPVPCDKCAGIGWVPLQPCHKCKGNGVIWEKQRIRLQVPAYSTPGTKLRIPALGKINAKTLEQGDLYFQIRKKIFGLI
ncbi:MAG: zinc finger domain-containing protein [Candidatus Hodarchaeales archaeon]